MGIFSEIKNAKDLWDKYKIPTVSKKGIKQYHSARSDLSEKWWEEFFTSRRQTPTNIIIMGQALSRTFSNKKQSAEMVKWLKLGASIKILMLSPDSTESYQLLHVSNHISYKNSESSMRALERKILDTVETLNSNIISHVPEIDQRPFVRYSTIDMPFSLIAIDDDMVVTLYGVRPEGDNQSTFHIHGKKTESYLSFYAEFEIIWNNYSKISPYADSIIEPFKEQWLNYIKLSNYEYAPPPPTQVTIYPTYSCSETCSYCMYKNTRDRAGNAINVEEMRLDSLVKLITELAGFGVNRIEISGGGEPLEYSHFSEFLQEIKKLKSKFPNISFGLLTNGMHIDKYLAKDLLYAFDDYIRISRFESVSLSSDQNSNNENHTWLSNVCGLLEEKRKDHRVKSNIGIKYLLCKTSKMVLPEIIKADIDNSDLDGIGHMRIKSERTMDQSSINESEQHIYYLLLDKGLLSSNKEISLSLTKTDYPPNYRCWMSPANSVVTPNGETYICCNYIYDKNTKCIGSSLTNSFSEIWKSKKHQELRMNIRNNNCDRPEYCNCRYADVQSKFEKFAPFIEAEYRKRLTDGLS